MKNEILEEVWRIRAELAREYGNDIDAIIAAMQERERHPLTRMVDPPKPKEDGRAESAECDAPKDHPKS